MLQPVVDFFDKLIDNFSWRRLAFVLIAALIAAICLWAYEGYTGSFKLARIEKQTALLEKLSAVTALPTVQATPDLKKIAVVLQRQLLIDAQASSPEREPMTWQAKSIAAALAWVMFALFIVVVPADYSEQQHKTHVLLITMTVISLPFIAIAALIPTYEDRWVNYLGYPIGHIVGIFLFSLLYQHWKQWKHAQAIAAFRAAHAGLVDDVVG